MQYSTTSPALETPQDSFFFDVGSLYEHLERLTDHRDPRGVRYPLAVALVFVILAKLAGEDEPHGIAQWVALRQELLRSALRFERASVPHPTTYSRILGNAVEVEQLQKVASAFLLSLQTSTAAVALNLDGKTLRGTIPVGQTHGVHLLAAYLSEAGIVLMQVEVEGHENEIVAAPRLLKMIDLRGKIITGDAMLAQRELSKQIVEGGGHYIWAVKENQPSLLSDIAALFAIEEGETALKPQANDFRSAESTDKEHGRLEQRKLTSSSMLAGEVDWPYLQQVFKIEREVEELTTGKRRREVSYGITSLNQQQADAARLLASQRQHWQIENGLHYRRDKTLREDASRLRTGQAVQAMAVINNLVIGLVLRQGQKNLPDARRHYDARPLEALKLILHR
jgi:predicted transposase YbfD/YdcC